MKWLNTLKQIVGKFPTSCLSVFNHFVKLALKGLTFKILVLKVFHNALLEFIGLVASRLAVLMII